MSVQRLVVIVALLLVPGLPGVGRAASAATQPSGGPAAVIRLSGEVDDYSRDALFRRFREAQAAGAKTVILEIDTYGGLATSALDISQFLRGQTAVHTIAFVNNKAISAGAMIAMACDEIVMAPGSVLGNCAPIKFDQSGNMEGLPPAERAKQQSPILRDFEDNAKKNGYSLAAAEAMVRVETSVYLVRNEQGVEKAVDQPEYQRLTASGEWQPATGVSNPVDGPETLLTVGPDLAGRLGLSKGIAQSPQALAADRGYTIVADLTPSFGDHLIEALNSGTARFVLLVVFMLSLYVAIHAPGHGAAEAIAIISLGLLVGVPLLTGYAQWWEIGLIITGLALCAFEIFVFPGHGVSLVTGFLLVLFGLVMTFAGKDPGPSWLPTTAETWHHLRNGFFVVVGAMAASLVGGAYLQRFLPKLPLFRRLILTQVSGGTVPTPAGPPMKAGDDVWPFLGTVGVAASDLKPGGVVRFPYGADTRTAPVVSAAGFVPEGTRVVVQEARGNRIVVRTA
jgi:membrane-bound serine protease (ClpP class)